MQLWTRGDDCSIIDVSWTLKWDFAVMKSWSYGVYIRHVHLNKGIDSMNSSHLFYSNIYNHSPVFREIHQLNYQIAYHLSNCFEFSCFRNICFSPMLVKKHWRIKPIYKAHMYPWQNTKGKKHVHTSRNIVHYAYLSKIYGIHTLETLFVLSSRSVRIR